MAQIINMQRHRDIAIAGTDQVSKLMLIVRILSINAAGNNAGQRVKLAAAQRLLGGK